MYHLGWRPKASSRRRGTVLVVALVALACARAEPGSKGSGESGLSCAPIQMDAASWARGKVTQEDPRFIQSVTPATVQSQADTVFYADSIDLNCDGRPDYVAHLLGSSTSSMTGRLAAVAYVSSDSGWRRVLEAPSSVEGREVLALAADLTGSGKRDLVFIGSDEGGYVPTVYGWHQGQYRLIRVPTEYHVRFEAEWDADCRERIMPGFVMSHGIQLLRESISPVSRSGHGKQCDLAADTLTIAADSLVLVRNSR